MKLPIAAFACALALPALATAQRGSGDAADIGESVFSNLSSKKIQQFDPVKVILDKKRDLKLDDKQIADLTQLENQVQWNIKRMGARIDTAQKSLNRESGGGTNFGAGRGGRGGRGGDVQAPPETPAQRRDRVLRARQTIIESVADLQREHDSARTLALAMLNATQGPGASELLNKHDDDLAKMLKDAGFGPKARH